jgi:hypothetical protein
MLDDVLNVFNGVAAGVSRRNRRDFAAPVAAAMCRGDRLGAASSAVRALGLPEKAYARLCAGLRSMPLMHMEKNWQREVGRMEGLARTSSGRAVLAADGLLRPREGKRMPGVCRLRKNSGNQASPESFLGHSWTVCAAVFDCGAGAAA